MDAKPTKEKEHEEDAVMVKNIKQDWIRAMKRAGLPRNTRSRVLSNLKNSYSPASEPEQEK